MRHLVFDQMEQCSEAEVARMLQTVPEFRCQQALKFKHLFGQYACLKAYELLWQLLQEEGVEEMPLFEIDTNGKPFLKGNPHLFFSLSHCKEAIAVAVDSKPIGIDVESFREYSSALLQRTMNEGEQQIIQAAPNPAEQFIHFWTQKEAVLKLRGTGIVDDLHHVLEGPELIQTWSHTSKPYACSVATTR